MMRVHTHTHAHTAVLPGFTQPVMTWAAEFIICHGLRSDTEWESKKTHETNTSWQGHLSAAGQPWHLCVFVCLCVCVFVCSWRYFLTHSNSLLPSALSSSADLCVILFSRFADQRDSSELFTLYFVFRGAGSRFCCLCNKSDNWKLNCGWNFNSVSFSLQELLLL